MIHTHNDGYVRTEKHNTITTIEFFHPQSNSLPGRLLENLATEIHAAGNDDETRVIILQAGGDKAFCAGASFDELLAVKNAEEGLKFFSGFAHVINAMRKCPQFIVARIHGKCVGGGVGIAAAADYAIASENAEIKLSELAIGIGPFVVGPVIERKIGVAAYSHLAIDASMWRNSDWAKRKGLFAEVHANTEMLDEAVRRLSGSLAHSSMEAMHEMKKIFWHGTEHWDKLLADRAAISGRLITGRAAREALEKWKKK